jgi:hypothetical protein
MGSLLYISPWNRQFIYPQMAPIAQINGPKGHDSSQARGSPFGCNESPLQVPAYLRHLRNLRIQLPLFG